MQKSVLAAALIALAFAACSSGGSAKNPDPCAEIICLAGQDCVDGKCQDRVPPTEDCTSNTQCITVPGRPYCDLQSGVCVQCTEDVHCAEGFTCVANLCDDGKCQSDAECPDAAPRCRGDGQCVVCLGAGDCATGEVCSAGACQPSSIPCQLDPECLAADPGRPVCKVDATGGHCVECLGRASCGEGQDCVADACVSFACGAGADCSAFPDRSHCDSTGLCVACLAEEDCPAGKLCQASACVPKPPCESNSQCAGDPVGQLCNTQTGLCVFCRDDGDCPVGRHCSDDGALCASDHCTQSSECPPGFVCDASSCQPGPACTDDGGCNFDPRAPRCSDAGQCVVCLDGGDCGRGLSCIDGQCQQADECTDDASCSGAYVCEGRQCVACRTDDECPRGVCDGGFCGNPATCKADVDCGSGVCAKGACVECASDLDCRPGLWCEAGVCGEASRCQATDECGPDRTCQAGACTSVRCVDDAREPDSTLVMARPAPASGPVFGSVCPNDDDWMVIAANAGVGFESRMTGAPGGTRLTLFWFDAATGKLQQRESLTDVVRVRALPAARQDRYYLRVRSTGAGQYILVNKVTPAGLDCSDVLEPNDVYNKAAAITTGTTLEGLTSCGDQDWFSFVTPGQVPLRAYVFSRSAVEVSLFDSAGKNIASAPAHAVPYLGGGMVVESLGDKPLLGSYLLRVTSTDTSAEYSVYVATGDDPVCAASLPLLESGHDRARIQGTTLGRRPDAPAGACGAGGPDATYQLVLQAPARLKAALGAGYNARLSLLGSTCGTEQSCAPFSSGRGALDVPRVAAGTYVIAVSGAGDVAGPFDLAVRALPTVNAPANDRCVGASHLDITSGKVALSGSTVGAAADIDPSCSVPVPDVFYGFTLTSQRRVILDVAADGPVYAAITDAASCRTESSCGGPSSTVHVDETLPAGDYALVIGSAGGVAVSFDVNMVVPPAVVGETCAGAQLLAVPSTVRGDTTYARDDQDYGSDVTCTSYFTGGNDVFYRFSATANSTYTFKVTPDAPYDAAVYVIGDCAAPQCLVGADAGLAGQAETVTFKAPAAGTYRVVIDGAEGGGTFGLEAK